MANRVAKHDPRSRRSRRTVVAVSNFGGSRLNISHAMTTSETVTICGRSVPSTWVVNEIDPWMEADFQLDPDCLHCRRALGLDGEPPRG